MVDELYEHVSWCIWHEEVRLYDNKYPGNLISVASLREQCVPLEHHKPTAQAVIIKATDNELLEVMSAVESRVEQEHQLKEHFTWIADHEGQRATFNALLAAGDYNKIRSIYHGLQVKKPNARSLLCCVSNQYLENLIKTI